MFLLPCTPGFIHQRAELKISRKKFHIYTYTFSLTADAFPNEFTIVKHSPGEDKKHNSRAWFLNRIHCMKKTQICFIKPMNELYISHALEYEIGFLVYRVVSLFAILLRFRSVPSTADSHVSPSAPSPRLRFYKLLFLLMLKC